MTHTPGPWSVDVQQDETLIESRYYTICRDVGNCDASLIAAAPDLLAVAQYAVDNPEFSSEEFDQIARAAIAKALGK